MFLKKKIDPKKIKAESERIIRAANGRICDWLPLLDIAAMRKKDEIIARALILNALLQIHFQAPIDIVKSWIEKNGLVTQLSSAEKELLNKRNEDLSSQELTNLYWHIECLWALLWVGNLIDDLDFNQPIQDYMANLCPSLEKDENTSKFTKVMQIRPFNECFQILDLHYRLHWWMKQDQLEGKETNSVFDRVWERRKALEWVMDNSTDWDDVDLST